MYMLMKNKTSTNYFTIFFSFVQASLSFIQFWFLVF